MNLNWLTLRDFEALLALADYLHFGKAAQAIHLTQPALSRQIKKIEDILGFPIFARTKRSVEVTENGRLAVAQVRKIWSEVQKLAEVSDRGLRNVRGSLRIGSIFTLGPYLIPHLLPSLRSRFPEAQFIFKEGKTPDLIRELERGTLDLVLAADTFDRKGICREPLFEEPLLLISANDHPLTKKSAVSIKDIRREEMLVLEEGHCLKDQALSFCKVGRSSEKNPYQATSLETIKHLVGAGLGYSLIPLLATINEKQTNQLYTYRELDGIEASRQIVIAYARKSPRANEIDLLARHFRDQLQTLAATGLKITRPA
jgi:LysR family hydrogen peroxide-inducible transcriptional activator